MSFEMKMFMLGIIIIIDTYIILKNEFQNNDKGGKRSNDLHNKRNRKSLPHR